jgi:hypothetical protein
LFLKFLTKLSIFLKKFLFKNTSSILASVLINKIITFLDSYL